MSTISNRWTPRSFELGGRRFFILEDCRLPQHASIQWDDGHHAIPATLSAALELSATQFPDKEAIVEGKQRVTYGILWRRSEAVAGALSAAGIRRGDHVGMCVGNGVEWAEIFYGIVRVGAVAVPVNTRLKPSEIAYQLQNADVKLLFTASTLLKINFVEMLRSICPAIDRTLPSQEFPELRTVVVLDQAAPAGCLTFDTFLAGKPECTPFLPDPEDVALIQYTSGTTSLPKGVLLTHRNIVTDAYFVGKRMGVTSRDRYLSARPFFHVAGSTLSVVLACVHGATLVTMQRFVPEDALRLLSQEHCTLTAGNDTMYLMMLGSADFPKWKYHLRGGWAAVSGPILRRIADEMGATETVTGYGLSEASPNIVTSDCRDPLEERANGWMRLHPGLEIRIADPETGATLAAGERGEIQVRGWCVMKGYYRNEEATANVMTADGFLRTGDLGILKDDGRMAFVGRLKEIIRVGGENVAPSEIENVLHQHPRIRQAQVFGLPDPRLLEVVGTYIVPKDGETLTEAEVIEWLKPRLASFKMPKYISIIDTFDIVGMTASAKVPKKLLVEHAIRQFGLAAS